jgi:hypothetical protein
MAYQDRSRIGTRSPARFSLLLREKSFDRLIRIPADQVGESHVVTLDGELLKQCELVAETLHRLITLGRKTRYLFRK